MKALAAFASLVLVSACQAPPAEMTEAEIAQIEAEVMEVASGINDGFRALDAQSVAVAFHPTESGFAWGGSVYNGTDIVEPLATILDNRVADDRQWLDARVKVITRDVAMFQGIADATMEDTSGEVTHYPGNIIFTLLFERTDEGWKSTFGAITSGPFESLGEA